MLMQIHVYKYVALTSIAVRPVLLRDGVEIIAVNDLCSSSVIIPNQK